MKLHGNAALSWSGRRRLAERVVVEGWTLAAAAEAAGVSVRCARKWVGRYRLEGERRNYAGYECVHVGVDDYSRLAYAEVLPDEKTTTAIGFLERAVAFYRSRGIRVERLLTDNGCAYVSAVHARACRRLSIRH